MARKGGRYLRQGGAAPKRVAQTKAAAVPSVADRRAAQAAKAAAAGRKAAAPAPAAAATKGPAAPAAAGMKKE